MAASDGNIGLLNRALENLRHAWHGISGESEKVTTGLSASDAVRCSALMRDSIIATRGEVSARGQAAALGEIYLTLNSTGKQRFLMLLVQQFGVDYQAIVSEARRIVTQAETIETEALKTGEPICLEQIDIKLIRSRLEAPWMRLLTRFNALPQGVKFLVDLRTDLRSLYHENPALVALEADIARLLTSWFDVGFLELRQITWDSPAAVLEKLIAYEAVHAINDWQDMKHRLVANRRCFAYFHPRMPDEPLIFVEVALVSGIVGNVQILLDRSASPLDPHYADSALFYSITNTQPGLAGVSFGEFLIKRVVEQLALEFPNLRNFATLSPIPGFYPWLKNQLKQTDFSLPTSDSSKLRALLVKLQTEAGEKHLDILPDPDQTDQNLLCACLEIPDWQKNLQLTEVLRIPIMRLCVRYLTQTRTIEDEAEKGIQAIDRVAHFHLSNGARIEKINWQADISANGLRQSLGLMVNYLYQRSMIDENHARYMNEGQIVLSAAIRKLLRD